MRLGLLGDERAHGADLALDRRHRLAGGLADRGGNARDVGAGRGHAAELLDPARDRPLVLLGLLEVRLQALLVGRLLGQLDVRRQVELQLGFLGMGLVEPLDELCVTLGEGLVLGWHAYSSGSLCRVGTPTLLSFLLPGKPVIHPGDGRRFPGAGDVRIRTSS